MVDPQAESSSKPRSELASTRLIKSGKAFIAMIGSAALSFFVRFLDGVAVMAVLKPNLAASFSLASERPTGRTSPDKLISPNTTLSLGKGTSKAEEAIAAATARSAAGSFMRNPPATLS